MVCAIRDASARRAASVRLGAALGLLTDASASALAAAGADGASARAACSLGAEYVWLQDPLVSAKDSATGEESFNFNVCRLHCADFEHVRSRALVPLGLAM
jgi:hypothetical protein